MVKSQGPHPQNSEAISVTSNMRQGLIAGTAVAAGVLCFLALLACDDRELVWHEGSLFEIGQFVEVASPSAALPFSTASASSVGSVAP